MKKYPDDECDKTIGVYCMIKEDFDNNINVENAKSINKEYEEAGINNPNISNIQPIVGRNRWVYKN